MKKNEKIVQRMQELDLLRPFTGTNISPKDRIEFREIAYMTIEVEIPYNVFDRLIKSMVILDIKPKINDDLGKAFGLKSWYISISFIYGDTTSDEFMISFLRCIKD
jgi:hypothetical protein